MLAKWLARKLLKPLTKLTVKKANKAVIIARFRKCNERATTYL